jgi:hypothetical protein
MSGLYWSPALILPFTQRLKQFHLAYGCEMVEFSKFMNFLIENKPSAY